MAPMISCAKTRDPSMLKIALKAINYIESSNTAPKEGGLCVSSPSCKIGDVCRLLAPSQSFPYVCMYPVPMWVALTFQSHFEEASPELFVYSRGPFEFTEER